MGFYDYLRSKIPGLPRIESTGVPKPPGDAGSKTSEAGRRTTADELQIIHNRLWVDTRLLQTIREIRRMDATDGRVKKIHGRSARTAAKGGLRLMATGQPRLEREWNDFRTRTKINNAQKLQSDLRGLMMEGHLALQWVLDQDERIVGAVRMPPETLRANVGTTGVFENPEHAYDQVDLGTGRTIAKFGLWQLTLGRLDPQNFDDWGSPGRPYLDANRSVWKKLEMTEEDLVIRRHMRSPMRISHSLEGATPEELAAYRSDVERDQASGSIRDYYSNKKSAVTPVQGDANLDQIADVVHLLDTFASGSPMPKGLFGYIGDLSRDILEDLKKDWYEELAAMQTVASSVYTEGFRLHLLLRGINPDAYDFAVSFEERLTDTPNQRADHALKIQALGASQETVFETAGLNAVAEREAITRERAEMDPYPDDLVDEEGNPIAPAKPTGQPRVSVTPGNAPKGESATSITTR